MVAFAGEDDLAVAGASLCRVPAVEEDAVAFDGAWALLHWVEEEEVSEIALICIIPPYDCEMSLSFIAIVRDSQAVQSME